MKWILILVVAIMFMGCEGVTPSADIAQQNQTERSMQDRKSVV